MVTIAILSYDTSGWLTIYGADTGKCQGRGEEPAENEPQLRKNSFEMGMQ